LFTVTAVAPVFLKKKLKRNLNLLISLSTGGWITTIQNKYQLLHIFFGLQHGLVFLPKTKFHNIAKSTITTKSFSA